MTERETGLSRKLTSYGEPEFALYRRRATHVSRPAVGAERGYARLFRDHVLQADRGCDFDFLRPTN